MLTGWTGSQTRHQSRQISRILKLGNASLKVAPKVVRPVLLIGRNAILTCSDFEPNEQRMGEFASKRVP